MIPLEDNFTDILGKAQRGLNLTDVQLATKTRLPAELITKVKDGLADETVLAKLAPALNLNARALIAAAKKSWQPQPITCDGLAQFNTPFFDMTVNAYVVWDHTTREAALFDTGADARPALDFIAKEKLTLKYLFITHTHTDHIADLEKVLSETKAECFVGDREPKLAAAKPFEAGRTFPLGGLSIETRLTWGHAEGGITYVVDGLEHPVAIVGDAVFAGSMGGGAVSYADALCTNRSEIMSLPAVTILCPGHGPLTTVGEEQQHNPFFAA
ncbi:MAG: MBL fold metallo-hydrolase [Verrucomicrobiota bacterium]